MPPPGTDLDSPAQTLKWSRWLIAAGPAVIAITAAIALRSFEQRQALVEHTVAVIDEVNSLRQLTLVSEIQARNAIRIPATAGASNVNAQRALDGMSASLSALMRLTGDNPRQQVLLQPAAEALKDFGAQLANHSEREAIEAIRALDEAATKVTLICDRVEAEERQLLSERLRQRDETHRWLSLAFVLTVLVNIVSLAWGYIQMRRFQAIRERSNRELRESAEALERRVGERTAELRRAVAQLERSNADLERFAYSASHDLQEPLRIVGSYVSLLKKRYGNRLDADADKYIAFAADGAKRMQDMVNDLLVFSTLQPQTMRWAEVSLTVPLEAAKKYLAVAMEQAGADVMASPMPLVQCDANQIERVFRNLFSNSLKFAAPNRAPVIRVSAECRDGWCLVRVEDNGIGFDPQYAKQLFEVFARLHPRGRYPGTGTGLAIARRIVELHGGRIWAESTEGSGATVFFSLPIFGAKAVE